MVFNWEKNWWEAIFAAFDAETCQDRHTKSPKKSALGKLFWGGLKRWPFSTPSSLKYGQYIVTLLRLAAKLSMSNLYSLSPVLIILTGYSHHQRWHHRAVPVPQVAPSSGLIISGCTLWRLCLPDVQFFFDICVMYCLVISSGSIIYCLAHLHNFIY